MYGRTLKLPHSFVEVYICQWKITEQVMWWMRVAVVYMCLLKCNGVLLEWTCIYVSFSGTMDAVYVWFKTVTHTRACTHTHARADTHTHTDTDIKFKTCFTKGLTQNLNLRNNIKLEYNIKSLNYIQPNFRFQASFLYYWTMSFTFCTWSVV